MSLIVHFHDWYVSHNTCTLTLLVYSWFAFMRLWYELYEFWVFSDYVIYIWLVKNYFVFISLFEGSRSSFSRFSKTSSCSSLLVEIFKQTTLSNLFFWKPLPSMGGWMGDHVLECFIMKILFILNHDWVVGYMRYTLVFIVVSIGIIEFFQFGINLDILLYTHICFVLYMYAYTSYSINFNWYLFLTYIYRWFICAYYISISWSTNFGYDKLEFFNW